MKIGYEFIVEKEKIDGEVVLVDKKFYETDINFKEESEEVINVLTGLLKTKETKSNVEINYIGKDHCGNFVFEEITKRLKIEKGNGRSKLEYYLICPEKGIQREDQTIKYFSEITIN